MTSADEVAKALREDPRPADRILNFGALLARESGSEVVIVGGSAIEVYTEGGYHSGDIDLRGDKPAVHRVLARWGFRDQGRLWTHDDWKLAVDLVGDRYSGDPYRATQVETPCGPMRLAAVEELLVKRLARAKHWPGPPEVARDDVRQAGMLWETLGKTLDRDYLGQRARRYDVADLLADLVGKPESRREGGRARRGS